MKGLAAWIGEPFTISYNDTVTEGWKPLEHFHDACELGLFVRADVDIFVKDERYAITDGDVLFIDAYDLHRVIYKPDQKYTRYVINFHYDYIDRLMSELGLGGAMASIGDRSRRKLHLDLRERLKVEGIFAELLRLQERVSRGQGGAEPQAAIKLNLLLLLHCLYELGQDERRSGAGNRLVQPVREAIRYLDGRYAEPFRLDHLEAFVGRSKFGISHMFKASTGFTVIEYLQYRRVIEAQRLLGTTEAPIIDIGLECGFQSVQHFYRVFKKITRQTPAEFRRNRGGGDEGGERAERMRDDLQ